MKKIIFVLLSISLSFAQDTIRVATYNILNYNGSTRNEYLKPVTQEVNADILIVQEMISQTAVDSFSISVLENKYSTISFNNGTDTDNHIFYRTDKVEFISDSYISTELRDIAEYKLKINSTNDFLFIYSAHLKASTGSDNEQKRLAECIIWRDHLNQHPAGTNFIILGDFNFYTSSEPGYQKLIGSEADNDGRSFDPIDAPGTWHNLESFAGIHTQSPRAEQFGGGAHGGLDDRFDFILISEALSDEVRPSTYTEFGNDGQHFNVSINDGVNGAVGSEMADALYYGSDHLPVYCDFVFANPTSLEKGKPISTFELYQNYPNPFNPTTNISFYLPRSSDVNLVVYNSLGQKVKGLLDQKMTSGLHTTVFSSVNLSSGIYYYKIKSSNGVITKKMLLYK